MQVTMKDRVAVVTGGSKGIGLAVARQFAASGAKVQIGKSGRLISQDAVQIHGGMGMTDELNVGHFFKRVTMIESQFGNTDWHLRRYTELSAT